MSRIHAPMVHAGLIAGSILFAAGVPAALAQSTQPPQGPITNVPGGLLGQPDLIVSEATTAVCAPNGTVTINIDAYIKNVGNAAADLSAIPWHIIVEATWSGTPNELVQPVKQTVKPQAGIKDKSIAAGATVKARLSIVGISPYQKIFAVPNRYIATVTVDPTNGVKESNEKNNTAQHFVDDPCFGK